MRFQKVRPVFISLLGATLCAAGSVAYFSTESSIHNIDRGSASNAILGDTIERSKPRSSKRSTELARALTRSSIKDGSDGVTAHLVHKVRRGETLGEIWSRFGSPDGGAHLAERALRAIGSKLHLLRAGEEIALKVSPEKGVVGFTRDLGQGKYLILDSARTSGYSAAVLDTPYQERERTVSGQINSSLFSAAKEQGVPFEMIDQMADLLSDKIEFTRDIQPGDTFSLIYTEKLSETGETIGSSELKAVSLTNNGQMLAAVAFTGSDGKQRYYDHNGALLGNYFLRYPVKFSRISSVFSEARFHPVLKIRRPHNGVDFAAPIGTAVRSVADGIVESAGYSGGAGKLVKIRHDQRYSTAYLHLNSISAGLKKGARVSRGQVIGTVGMTGLATGPHLHFSLYDRGSYVNPMKAKLPVLAANGESIPKTVLAALIDRLQVDQNHLLAKANQKETSSPG